ncbi:aminoglycoside N(3)-acetyltransferase [Streptomyces sp. NPDC002073]|uniref:aminoglycoside N(3)-acetyltransferase n=1 Tax=Streptomyces sp. NBC_00239 TaxID=2903640 RepID=UPI002E28884F|nr:AAC(3) family N-acetyltransferase [Streptomyces sp. NBC_00239]
MSPREVVTRGRIADGLAALGVGRGEVVVVHSSLRSFGFVPGGAQSVYEALREAVGADGTLVMPAFTPQLCHPGTWRSPDLVQPDPSAVAADMPLFDPERTPVARTMGVLPELLRAVPGSVRSRHPHVSFVAEGPRAQEIVRSHPDAYRLSSQSPLGELWRLDATVLMLGTEWNKCTALHLAEYTTPYPGRRAGLWALPGAGPEGSGPEGKGPEGTGPGGAGTRWREVPELLVWEGDFDALGASYEASGGPLSRTRVGGADCRAVKLRPLVEFAAGWLPGHRDLRRGVAPPGWREVAEADGPLPLPPLGVPAT